MSLAAARAVFVAAVVGLLLASCRDLYIAQKAPRPALEGARQITDDTYLYEHPRWSPDGQSIAITRNVNNQFKLGPDLQGWEVVLVDVQSGDITPLYGPGWQSIPAWSPDGDELAYATRVVALEQDEQAETTYQLTIYSVPERTERHLACHGCGDPIWLADGTLLVSANLGLDSNGVRQYGTEYVNPTSGENYGAVPFAGMPDLEVTVPGSDPILMVGLFLASPTADSFLMTAIDRECSGIWIYHNGSEGPIPLIDDPAFDECDPALSADGSTLLYTVKAPGAFFPTTIMVADPDGSSPAVLFEPGGDPFQARTPSWSPDGTQIAFVYGFFDETAPSYSTLYIADVPPDLRPNSRK
jgi:Tol biopolymer transport system component